MVSRGRPKLRSDAELLASALAAFASHGYEGVSLRTLSVDLGLSHSTLGQRFGSKENLYRVAIDAEFRRFFDEIARQRATWPSSSDDLSELRILISSFLAATSQFPALGQLMNQECAESTWRSDYVIQTVVRPQITQISGLLDRLRQSGQIRPISTRGLFFMVAHGAEAPFTLRALSAAFDDIDGAIEPTRYIATMTDIIMSALVVTSPINSAASLGSPLA